MIRVTVNGSGYQIKTTWDEFTVNDLLACTDARSELIAASTLPADLIYKARPDHLFPFYTILSFMHDVANYKLAPDTKAIERESYDQFVQCCSVIQEQVNPYQRAIKAALIYYPEELSVNKLMEYGASIVLQVNAFLESYSELNYKDPKEEGSDYMDRLRTMGPWGTVYAMAGKDLTKMDAIFKKSTIEVYTAMIYNFREAMHHQTVKERRLAQAEAMKNLHK